MPARISATHPPRYRLHKPSGQAVVTFGRKDHYLGVHNTRESLEAYHRLIAQWHADGQQFLPNANDVSAQRRHAIHAPIAGRGAALCAA